MRKVWRGMGGLAALGVVTLGLAACEPALEAPGKTGDIRLVDTATVDGWRFETFVNDAYPCAVSGYQTFAVGTKVGSSPTVASPLWVRMRGAADELVLAAGGSKDAADLVEDFLGRPYTFEAFQTWLDRV